jgi:hypothetical protein
MNHTTRHILFAVAWLFGLPLIAVPLFVSGALPISPLHSVLVSAAWGVGLVAVFASWALRDAPAHGKSKNVALAFAASWFVLFFFAVLPYLFVTRGAKAGALASLKFVSLCVACGIVWLLVPLVARSL